MTLAQGVALGSRSCMRMRPVFPLSDVFCHIHGLLHMPMQILQGLEATPVEQLQAIAAAANEFAYKYLSQDSRAAYWAAAMEGWVFRRCLIWAHGVQIGCHRPWARGERVGHESCVGWSKH